jgi:hypothetical protein
VFQFRLAKDLGKTLAEVRQMSGWEFLMWNEFYQREHDAIKAASKG